MYTRHTNKNSHNKTVRKFSKSPNIFGNIVGRRGTWKILHVYGEPYSRGFAHGYLLRTELKSVLKSFPFMVKKHLEMSLPKYIQQCNAIMKPTIVKNYSEYYDELRGISAGARRGGVNISLDFLISWNSYISMTYYLTRKQTDKCSAFIATGNATEKGDIIMAHNTHTDFLTGQMQNIIIYITPASGHPFVMQTSPGFICSVTDWFLCSTGIIGCETTISAIDYTPKFGDPFFCRIRKAMQYGETLDDYVEILSKNNSGDYACSWLLGDLNSNEIMLFELGLKYKHVDRKKNGVFYGMNSAMDKKLREKETYDIDHYNTSTSVGARNYRLNELLNKKYYGKINMENSKTVLADHYDVHMNKNIMNGRSICKHMELDKEHCALLPYALFGCTDGKVVNRELAKNMSFFARFGSACGREFSIKKHIKEHPEFSYWKGLITDFKKEKWEKIDM
jgi:hypothetical protein